MFTVEFTGSNLPVPRLKAVGGDAFSLIKGQRISVLFAVLCSRQLSVKRQFPPFLYEDNWGRTFSSRWLNDSFVKHLVNFSLNMTTLSCRNTIEKIIRLE